MPKFRKGTRGNCSCCVCSGWRAGVGSVKYRKRLRPAAIRIVVDGPDVSVGVGGYTVDIGDVGTLKGTHFFGLNRSTYYCFWGSPHQQISTGVVIADIALEVSFLPLSNSPVLSSVQLRTATTLNVPTFHELRLRDQTPYYWDSDGPDVGQRLTWLVDSLDETLTANLVHVTMAAPLSPSSPVVATVTADIVEL